MGRSGIFSGMGWACGYSRLPGSEAVSQRAMAKMLTYILPPEGGGVCVCILVYLFMLLQRSRLSFHRECCGVLPWKEHRHNKIGASFSPRAATDVSGSMKTGLWLDDCPESRGFGRARLSPPPATVAPCLY